MISILLMVIGGLMIIVAIMGVLAILFQPLYEDYQVVIKRKDDYAQYATPSGQAYLRSRIKRYWTGLAILFFAGCIIFFTGFYMKYGARGFGMLLIVEDESKDLIDTDSEFANGIIENGDYVSKDNVRYSNYLIVRGYEVYYREERIGNVDDLRTYADNLDNSSKFCIVDSYAASITFKEVMNILSESGIDYEVD